MRIHTPRRLAALAAPLLLAASLTACGGGDGGGAPEDASKDDFCKIWNDEGDEGAFDPEASAEEQAKKLKEQLDQSADDLKDVGTPQDIPDDARDGFEVFVDTIGDVSEDDLKKVFEDSDPDALTGDLDGDDKKKVESFTTWAADYCG